jgi:transposase
MPADALGRPLRIIVTAGQLGDSAKAPALLEGKAATRCSPTSHDSNALRTIIAGIGATVVIPSNRTRRIIIPARRLRRDLRPAVFLFPLHLILDVAEDQAPRVLIFDFLKGFDQAQHL